MFNNLGATMAASDNTGTAKTQGLPTHGYVRVKPLAQYLGASEGTVWKWVAEGRMPAPVKFAPRFTAFPCEKIHAWLAERGAAA